METEKTTYILTPGASKSLKPTIDALVKASPKEFRAHACLKKLSLKLAYGRGTWLLLI
jgi:hypothetical protein